MQKYDKKIRKFQKGNVLFIILISIALFSALTYTMARTSRTVSYSKDSDDHAKIQEVLSFAEKVTSAIGRIHFQNDCRTSQITFTQEIGDGYENIASPNDERCNVFSYKGGAVKYLTPPEQLLDNSHSTDELFGEYIFTGNVCLDKIGTGTVDDSCEDDGIQNEELILFLPWVKETVCRTINSILSNPTLLEDVGTSFDNTKFNGNFSDGFAISDSLGGKTYNIGCFKSNISPDEGYHFYYTLLEK